MYDITFSEKLEPTIKNYKSHGESSGIWTFEKTYIVLEETNDSNPVSIEDLFVLNDSDLIHSGNYR